jgi:hypothetical protein
MFRIGRRIKLAGDVLICWKNSDHSASTLLTVRWNMRSRVEAPSSQSEYRKGYRPGSCQLQNQQCISFQAANINT